MRVLAACEESQTVCLAFRELGHEAYSCDIQECSGGFPEFHIKDDVRNVLSEHLDLVIAFPPCIYLTKAGGVNLFDSDHNIKNQDRYKRGLEAREFFMMFYNYDKSRVCIENPTPLKIFDLPEPTQIIQPFYFGHPYQKRTCLWLRGLPPLFATELIYGATPAMQSSWFTNGTGAYRAKNRSKTFSGVAAAMAHQWSDLLKE